MKKKTVQKIMAALLIAGLLGGCGEMAVWIRAE